MSFVVLLLTPDIFLLSLRESLLSNDSVISGMVAMRLSWMAVFEPLSSEERRRSLWWGLTSPFSSLVLGAGAIVAAWSLFNFMASNCDCRSHRKEKYASPHNGTVLTCPQLQKTMCFVLHTVADCVKSSCEKIKEEKLFSVNGVNHPFTNVLR